MNWSDHRERDSEVLVSGVIAVGARGEWSAAFTPLQRATSGRVRTRHDLWKAMWCDRRFLFSPNGADLSQPRAERSAALGWIAKGNPALKGRPMCGAARGNGSPLQGFVAWPASTQGDALGWNGSAPLGLNIYKRRAPGLHSHPHPL